MRQKYIVLKNNLDIIRKSLNNLNQLYYNLESNIKSSLIVDNHMYAEDEIKSVYSDINDIINELNTFTIPKINDKLL